MHGNQITGLCLRVRGKGSGNGTGRGGVDKEWVDNDSLSPEIQSLRGNINDLEW